MDSLVDKTTKFVSDGIGILITRHPIRTSIGALLGVILIITNHVVGNIFPPKINPFYGLSEWHFIFAGVFILHIPTLIQLIKYRPEFDEDIEAAFKTIEKAKQNGLPEEKVNQAYIGLCELVLEKSKRDEGLTKPNE